MTGKWETLRLDESPIEIIDGDRGQNYPKQSDLSKESYCLFLNTGNVTTEGFNFTDCSFISEDKDIVLRKGKLRRHDVVLTTRGTVGNVAFYDEAVPYANVRINSGMVILRAEPGSVLPRYLYLFLRSKIFKEQANSFSTGSAQPQLPIRDLRQLRIPLPPIPEQRAIAHVLGTLDDKIALNRRMNATLEAMARTLFKSWFVDFDPVRAKIEGRQPPGMDAETAALFPDSFEDSPVGKVPKGWRVGPLADIADIVMGQSPPGETYSEAAKGLPFYQGIRDFGFRFPSRRVYCTSPTRFAEKGDVLLSVRAPVGSLNVAIEPCSIGRGIAALRLRTKPGGFLYYLLKSSQSEWEKFEAGGTVFGSASKGDVRDFKVTIPSTDLIRRFGWIAESMDALIESNERENQTLITTRDGLLPKLMSGKVRVREALSQV